MATLGSFQRYHVIRGYTDMRKGIDGLAAIAILEYGQQLDDESIFLFCGRKADRLKGLYWDGTSYNIQYKRLPEGGILQFTVDESGISRRERTSTRGDLTSRARLRK